MLAAAYFGVEPLPFALCEIPVETVAAAGEWLRRRPQVRSGPVGLVGGSKGAELALLAATAYPRLFGPVAAIAPSCVGWFGVRRCREPDRRCCVYQSWAASSSVASGSSVATRSSSSSGSRLS